MIDEPVTVNEIQDLSCDICGKPLRGYTGHVAGLTRPISQSLPDVHEYFKAIHLSCYEGKPN